MNPRVDRFAPPPWSGARLPYVLAAVLAALLASPASGQTGEPQAADDFPDMVEPEAATSNPQAQFHVMMGELAANRRQPELAAREFLTALALVPDASLAARTTGLALAAGNLALTEQAALRWLEIEPTSLEAREVILRLALRRGAVDIVEQQADAIVQGHAGGRADGLRHVALLLAQEPDKPELSLGVMDELLKAYENEAAARYAAGLLALRFGRLDQAEQHARQARRMDPKSKEYGLLLAGVLVKRKSVDEADKVLDEVVRAHAAERDDLRLAYAKLLLEDGEREKARAQLQRILKDNPKNADARYALGVFAFNDGELDLARKQFEGFVKDPERASDAHFQLGRVAERQERYEDALEHYEAVNNGPQALDAAVRRAAVLVRLGRIGEARQTMQNMRQQFPPLGPRLLIAEAEMLVDAGRLDEALALYDDGLREDPEDAELLYGRSLVYDRLGRLAEAEADLRSVLSRDPNDARALNALGYLLTVNTPRLEEARALIGKALELSPEDAAIIDSMGWVEFKLGRAQEARELLQKAYDKFKDPEIAAHLGEVLWTLGERDQARAVWSQALAEEPDHRVLKETMQRLTQ